MSDENIIQRKYPPPETGNSAFKPKSRLTIELIGAGKDSL